MKELSKREYWLVMLVILWGTLLGVVFLLMPIQEVIALNPAVIPTVPPYPTVPPFPTVVPPVTKVLTRGATLDEHDDFGLVLKNESCLTNPLTATVKIASTNPITVYFPITGAFQAFGDYRYIMLEGADCDDPDCANLLTAKFYYTPTSASDYHLWYWDWRPSSRGWKRVNESVGPSALAFPDDAWTFELFNCDMSIPGIENLSSGIVFAWGYTTTAQIPYYFPVIYKNYP